MFFFVFFFPECFKNNKNSQLPFEEISSEELDKFRQKFYLSAGKRDDRGFGHYTPKL